MTDTILRRIHGLKNTSVADLKEQWKEFFGSPPPPYNRRFLESRLAYWTCNGFAPVT